MPKPNPHALSLFTLAAVVTRRCCPPHPHQSTWAYTCWLLLSPALVLDFHNQGVCTTSMLQLWNCTGVVVHPTEKTICTCPCSHPQKCTQPSRLLTSLYNNMGVCFCGGDHYAHTHNGYHNVTTCLHSSCLVCRCNHVSLMPRLTSGMLLCVGVCGGGRRCCSIR
jgi:hypothetical protein